MSCGCHIQVVFNPVFTFYYCAVNYGTEIKSRRLARGWTQSELAQRCELTLLTIQRLEKGEVTPSLLTQSKLQEVLNMRWQSEDQDPAFTINQSLN